MRIYIANALFIGLIIITSCNKEDDNYIDTSDKKVIIGLYSEKGSTSIHDTTVYSTNALMFNKTDYSNVDSIVLVTSGVETVSSSSLINVKKEIVIELYDLTNDKPIENSKIVTDDILSSETVASMDIKDFLPKSAINLGIRITITNHANFYVKIQAISLIIYK